MQNLFSLDVVSQRAARLKQGVQALHSAPPPNTQLQPTVLLPDETRDPAYLDQARFGVLCCCLCMLVLPLLGFRVPDLTIAVCTGLATCTAFVYLSYLRARANAETYRFFLLLNQGVPMLAGFIVDSHLPALEQLYVCAWNRLALDWIVGCGFVLIHRIRDVLGVDINVVHVVRNRVCTFPAFALGTALRQSMELVGLAQWWPSATTALTNFVTLAVQLCWRAPEYRTQVSGFMAAVLFLVSSGEEFLAVTFLATQAAAFVCSREMLFCALLAWVTVATVVRDQYWAGIAVVARSSYIRQRFPRVFPWLVMLVKGGVFLVRWTIGVPLWCVALVCNMAIFRAATLVCRQDPSTLQRQQAPDVAETDLEDVMNIDDIPTTSTSRARNAKGGNRLVRAVCSLTAPTTDLTTTIARGYTAAVQHVAVLKAEEYEERVRPGAKTWAKRCLTALQSACQLTWIPQVMAIVLPVETLTKGWDAMAPFWQAGAAHAEVAVGFVKRLVVDSGVAGVVFQQCKECLAFLGFEGFGVMKGFFSFVGNLPWLSTGMLLGSVGSVVGVSVVYILVQRGRRVRVFTAVMSLMAQIFVVDSPAREAAVDLMDHTLKLVQPLVAVHNATNAFTHAAARLAACVDDPRFPVCLNGSLTNNDTCRDSPAVCTMCAACEVARVELDVAWHGLATSRSNLSRAFEKLKNDTAPVFERLDRVNNDTCMNETKVNESIWNILLETQPPPPPPPPVETKPEPTPEPAFAHAFTTANVEQEQATFQNSTVFVETMAANMTQTVESARKEAENATARLNEDRLKLQAHNILTVRRLANKALDAVTPEGANGGLVRELLDLASDGVQGYLAYDGLEMATRSVGTTESVCGAVLRSSLAWLKCVLTFNVVDKPLY